MTKMLQTVELRRHLGELQLAHVRLLEENEMKDVSLYTDVKTLG